MKKAVLYILSIGFIVTLFFTACEPLDIKRATKIQTGTAMNISYRSAEIQGLIIDVSDDLREVGHCWSQSPEPTIDGEHMQSENSLSPGEQIYTRLDNLNNGYTYYVRAYAITDKEVIYGEEINFQLQSIPADWNITFINPQEDKLWPMGESKMIEWQSSVQDTFIVDLFDISNNSVIEEIGRLAFTPDNNTYSINYTLPNDIRIVENNSYYIRVSCVNFDIYQMLRFIATKPIITVNKPINGETVLLGRDYKITWTSQSVDRVDILLYQNNSFLSNIAEGQINSYDYYNWTVDELTYSAGSNYQIEVRYSDYPNYKDYSGNFTIEIPNISITTPTPNTSITSGTPISIVWTSNLSSAENIKIELLQNSTVMHTIAASTPNTGSYDWNTSNIAAGTYDLVVSSADYNIPVSVPVSITIN